MAKKKDNYKKLVGKHDLFIKKIIVILFLLILKSYISQLQFQYLFLLL